MTHELVRLLVRWAEDWRLPCDISLAGDIAIFSPDRLHRYVLTRGVSTTNAPGRVLATIGLNPSTANAFKDDRTIGRMRRFASSWGCDLFVMLNAYAFRTPSPHELFEFTGDRVGPRNADAIRFVLERLGERGIALAAWGVHAELARVDRIVGLAYGTHVRLECLGTNKDGSPKHPLYLKGDTERWPWPQPNARAT